MRKIFVAIAVICSTVYNAQTVSNSVNNAKEDAPVDNLRSVKNCYTRFHLGIKVGANKSNVYDTQGEAFQAESKYGFAGGAFLDIPLGRVLGIHPEVLYSQKGFKASGKITGTNYDLIRTTSFIDVPILLAVKPICPVTLFAGPQYSYLIHQTDVFAEGFNSSASSEEFKNENIRKNILGAVVGLDVNIRNLVIGARYNVDMLLNNGDGSSSAPRYKNTWLQGTIGFRIF